MAYDEKFADRIRQALGRRKGLVAKQMFGGIAFLLNGNMCVGIHKDELIVRLDPDATDAALAKPHTRVFHAAGRQCSPPEDKRPISNIACRNISILDIRCWTFDICFI